MNKKNILVIAVVLLIIIFGFGLYYYLFICKEAAFFPQSEIQTSVKEQKEQEAQRQSCLADDEWATILPSYWDFGSNFKSGQSVNVYLAKKGEIVFDGVSEEESKRQIKEKNLFNFPIPNVAGGAYPPNILKCGAYIVRKFFERGGKYELWHYNYAGKGKNILTLSVFDEKGNPIGGTGNFYTPEIKVDHTETYIALIRSWYGEPENHALVIKDLKTMEDKYVITLNDLTEKFSDVEPATISLDYWGQERFETGDIFGFHFLNSERTGFSINIKTKELKIFRNF